MGNPADPIPRALPHRTVNPKVVKSLEKAVELVPVSEFCSEERGSGGKGGGRGVEGGQVLGFKGSYFCNLQGGLGLGGGGVGLGITTHMIGIVCKPS